MKRLHVHISVAAIAPAVTFYSGLLGCEPAVLKPDYAKWMAEDPAVNLAISLAAGATGINHLGIQVSSEDELTSIENRLEKASTEVIEQRGATCCYAESEKSWTFDPDGVPWESFLTLGEAVIYGADTLDGAVEGHANRPRRVL